MLVTSNADLASLHVPIWQFVFTKISHSRILLHLRTNTPIFDTDYARPCSHNHIGYDLFLDNVHVHLDVFLTLLCCRYLSIS